MQLLAGALRLEVGNVFRAIEHIAFLAESRRGRIHIDEGDAVEMGLPSISSCRNAGQICPRFELMTVGPLRNKPTVPRGRDRRI